MTASLPELAWAVPLDADLPGTGWLAISGELSAAGGADGEVLDCVGADFPEDAVVATHESPRYLRPPGALVYGTAVAFTDVDAARTATGCLARPAFARCLARSVVADLGQTDAEVLDAEVSVVPGGAASVHRTTFVGGGAPGLVRVHLDVAIVGSDDVVSVLWFAEVGEPFADPDRDAVVAAIERRGRDR